MLVDNTNSLENFEEKSVPELKGADSMKKNVYKRKDGRWMYSKQQNGLLYYAISNTYRGLLEKIKNISPKQVRKVKKLKNSKNFTFAQYFDFFIDNFIRNKNYTKETVEEWDRISKKQIAFAFSSVPLEKLTTEQLQVFIDKIEKERLQEKVFQRVVRVLKKAFVTNRIKRDITLGLEKPKRKKQLIRTPLNLEEQIAFIKTAKNKSKNVFLFAMFSLIVGSRREETVNFNIKTDLDEIKNRIHIRGTKTRNADRFVDVTPAFVQFLKENMTTNTFGISKYYATSVIKEILTEINCDKCLHCLRHTCSANLYFLGARDKYRQMQLGHASTITTNDIYTNIRENITEASLRDIYGDLYPKF